MFDNLKYDIRRYTKESNFKLKLYLFFEQGIWAIVVYRFGRWVRNIKIPVISTILKMIAYFLFKLTEIVTGVSFPASAKIGKGIHVGHFGATIVHSHAVIGENCSIGNNVVIGTKGQGDNGTPIIGNNVFIGVGSKILGSVNIGDGANIGANAVVLEDVPEGSTVVGIPAKVVKVRRKDPDQRNVFKNLLVFSEFPALESPMLEYVTLLPL